MDISEGLKKVFLAGVGAIATTADAAKDLVDTLVKKGEITVEQGRVLNEELKRSAKEKMNDHVTVNIIKEYKDVMSAVDHMPKEERDVLREKLAALEKEEAEKRAAQAAVSYTHLLMLPLNILDVILAVLSLPPLGLINMMVTLLLSTITAMKMTCMWRKPSLLWNS